MKGYLKMLFAVSFVCMLWSCNKTKTFTNPEEKIQVKAQSEFIIKIASNHSTGYRWFESVPIDTSFLQLKFIDYTISNPNADGSGGFELWHFKANKPGTTTISLKYIPNWEANSESKKMMFSIEITN